MPLDAATASLANLPAVPRRPFRMGTLAIYQRQGGTLDLQPPERAPAVRLQPIPLLTLPARRFLSIQEAAEYVGVSAQTFREEVAEGRWPQPVRRGKTGRALTWDVRAIDRAADLVAGIAPLVAPGTADGSAPSTTKEALRARFK